MRSFDEVCWRTFGWARWSDWSINADDYSKTRSIEGRSIEQHELIFSQL